MTSQINVGYFDMRVNAQSILAASVLALDQAGNYYFQLDHVQDDLEWVERRILGAFDEEIDPTGFVVRLIRAGFSEKGQEKNSEYWVTEVQRNACFWPQPHCTENTEQLRQMRQALDEQASLGHCVPEEPRPREGNPLN